MTDDDVLFNNRGRIQWHVRCEKDDVGAHPDLNRWNAAEIGRIARPDDWAQRLGREGA